MSESNLSRVKQLVHDFFNTSELLWKSHAHAAFPLQTFKQNSLVVNSHCVVLSTGRTALCLFLGDSGSTNPHQQCESTVKIGAAGPGFGKIAILWVLGRSGENMSKQLFFTSPQPLMSLLRQPRGRMVDTWAEGRRAAGSVSPGINT